MASAGRVRSTVCCGCHRVRRRRRRCCPRRSTGPDSRWEPTGEVLPAFVAGWPGHRSARTGLRGRQPQYREGPLRRKFDWSGLWRRSGQATVIGYSDWGARAAPVNSSCRVTTLAAASVSGSSLLWAEAMVGERRAQRAVDFLQAVVLSSRPGDSVGRHRGALGSAKSHLQSGPSARSLAPRRCPRREQIGSAGSPVRSSFGSCRSVLPEAFAPQSGSAARFPGVIG